MWLKELVRYAIVGTASFGLDLAIIAVLVEWRGVDPVSASVIGYAVALAIDYAGAVRWVFSRRRLARERAIEMGLFALVGIVGLGVNTLVMELVTATAGLHYAIGKTAAGFAVMLFTFYVRRRLLFSTGSPLPTRRSTG